MTFALGLGLPSVVLLATLCCVVAASSSSSSTSPPSSPFKYYRLDDLRRFHDAPPTSLAECRALHTRLTAFARHNARQHNHNLELQQLPPSGSCGSASTLLLPDGPQPPSPSSMSSPVIYPTAYGADPSGRKDSTAAFAQAMAALLNSSAHAPVKMAANITNLGGATLDLQGGVYLISAPLHVPNFFGNLVIRGGTLQASPSFPADRTLVEIGDSQCSPPSAANGQGSCLEDIVIQDMYFNANHTAAGGLTVSHVMGTVVANTFFSGFLQTGLEVMGGHEVMISDTWLTENFWGSPRPTTSNSTGIRLDGNDHFITNVIVFAFTNVGVVINGGANLVTGLHTWNGGLENQGIVVDAQSTRLVSCYLDFNYLQLNDATGVTVTNTFFLQTGMMLVAVTGKVDGLVLTGATFNTKWPRAIQLNGTFEQGKVQNVHIHDNAGTSIGTVVRMQAQAAGMAADFAADNLLFDWIDRLQYSVAGSSGFVRHRATLPTGRNVSVVFETALADETTVFIELAQCES